MSCNGLSLVARLSSPTILFLNCLIKTSDKALHKLEKLEIADWIPYVYRVSPQQSPNSTNLSVNFINKSASCQLLTFRHL